MPKHIEDTHQEALFNWARNQAVMVDGEVYPLAGTGGLMYAVPNGGKRDKQEAARMKRQGTRAGVSDIHLPLPVSEWSGLWIELKRPRRTTKDQPKVTPAQAEWLALMAKLGHVAVVAYGAEQAKQAIRVYMGDRLINPKTLTLEQFKQWSKRK